MSKRTVILSAAAIWIFIKLPQEWWIHIAQLDMTDFIKETLFGVDATDSWSDGDRQPPVGARPRDRHRRGDRAIVYWIITRKAPPFDHKARSRRRPAAAGAARRGAVPQGPRRDQHLRLGTPREDRAHGHRLHHLRLMITGGRRIRYASSSQSRSSP